MSESRTPKYDAAIEPILADLKPGKRTCRVTGEEFEIIPQEIALLRKMRIPPPTTSLKFRRTRLGAFLNYYILHTRKSDKTGKQIISEFSEKSPYKVWEYEEWWKDDWSPLTYGRAYDPNCSFFDQFHEVDIAIPHASLIKDPANINSEYVLAGTAMKNCYMAFGGAHSEAIYYSESCLQAKSCVDCTLAWQCEQCYEVVNLHRSYDCRYCVECDDCLGGRFLFDCRGCTDCFMCSNLRNKKWCFENKQLSEEEYKKRVASINLGDRRVRDQYWKQFDEMVSKAKHRDVRIISSEESNGDAIRSSQGCARCFIVERSQNVIYGVGCVNAKDSLHTLAFDIELVYEGVRLYNVQRSVCVARLRDCANMEYSVGCNNCEYCFGCVGLRNAKFCILNKQYSEEEYWKLVDQIKVDMLQRGEYGEFFPLSLAPFPYVDSMSHTWTPFGAHSLDEALSYGAWTEKSEKQVPPDAVPASSMPTDITQVGDDVLQKVLLSDTGTRAFRIIKPELEFYRKYSIPLPTLHFDERRERRLARLRPLILCTRICSKCGIETQTTLPPDSPGVLLCTKCYLAEVY